MKISTKGRYGLRAMVDLAVHCDGESCISLKSIAERQGISEAYLEQLMATLKKNGFVKSIRGAQGGYILLKDAKEISVGDILIALEGPLDIVECVSENGNASCGSGTCNNCVTKNVWEKISYSLLEVVNSISLKNLVDDYINAEENQNGDVFF